MKKQNKTASGFMQLGATQMEKLKGGGFWLAIKTPDGKITTVWVD